MASTNKTSNYELSQWVKTDAVLMDDFNADNAKIDQAIKQVSDSMPKFAYGSYVGTDVYGKSNANELEFDFEPQVLFIDGRSLVRGQSELQNGSGYCYFTWEGNRVSWYSPQNYAVQMNSSLTTYYYLAVKY